MGRTPGWPGRLGGSDAPGGPGGTHGSGSFAPGGLDGPGGAGPLGGRHLRRRFGPVEADLWGSSGMIELLDADLRILWEEEPAPPAGIPSPDRSSAAGAPADGLARDRSSTEGSSVGGELAALLRSPTGGTLTRPGRIRIPARRRLTDPPPAHPAVARMVRVSPVRPDGPAGAGTLLEIATSVPGVPVVSVVLSPGEADGLADLLESWSGRR